MTQKSESVREAEQRKCRDCDVVLDQSNSHKGSDLSCKPCHAKRAREWRQANPEKIAASRKLRRAQDPQKHADHSRKWAAKNPAKVSEFRKKSLKNWKKNHPEKYAAKWKFEYALKKGEVQKPDACSLCGIVGRIEAHHDDYTKPFEVRWLCRKCHMAEDKKRRRLDAAQGQDLPHVKRARHIAEQITDTSVESLTSFLVQHAQAERKLCLQESAEEAEQEGKQTRPHTECRQCFDDIGPVIAAWLRKKAR